jgi:hypothetical protein
MVSSATTKLEEASAVRPTVIVRLLQTKVKLFSATNALCGSMALRERVLVINYDLFMSGVEKMRLHNLDSLGGERDA